MSRKISSLLIEEENFNKFQVNQIFKAYFSNPQIGQEVHKIPGLMDKLLKRNGTEIEKSLLGKYLETIAS